MPESTFRLVERDRQPMAAQLGNLPFFFVRGINSSALGVMRYDTSVRLAREHPIVPIYCLMR